MQAKELVVDQAVAVVVDVKKFSVPLKTSLLHC